MPESQQSNPSDPRRWLRRNRFQEGPDFLFLATQNGRPVEGSARPRQLDGVRLRMRAVRLAEEVGPDKACALVGCSRASLHRWRTVYDREGIEGLLDHSRRPHRLRNSVPEWVDLVIVAIRLNTYWNSKRISAEMERRGIYRVGADHIDRLFRTQGCSRGKRHGSASRIS